MTVLRSLGFALDGLERWNGEPRRLTRYQLQHQVQIEGGCAKRRNSSTSDIGKELRHAGPERCLRKLGMQYWASSSRTTRRATDSTDSRGAAMTLRSA